jgi:hypothetical protein
MWPGMSMASNIVHVARQFRHICVAAPMYSQLEHALIGLVDNNVDKHVQAAIFQRRMDPHRPVLHTVPKLVLLASWQGTRCSTAFAASITMSEIEFLLLQQLKACRKLTAAERSAIATEMSDEHKHWTDAIDMARLGAGEAFYCFYTNYYHPVLTAEGRSVFPLQFQQAMQMLLEDKDALLSVAACLTREQAGKLARLCRAGRTFVEDADKDAEAGRAEVFAAAPPMWAFERTRTRVAALYPQATPRNLWRQETMAIMNSLAVELVRQQELGVAQLVFERTAAHTARKLTVFGCHRLEVLDAHAFLRSMEAWLQELRRTTPSGGLHTKTWWSGEEREWIGTHAADFEVCADTDWTLVTAAFNETFPGAQRSVSTVRQQA